MDGCESNVAREVGQEILGEALERRKRVDELGRLDAPRCFAPEADPPEDRESPSPDRPQTRDAAADHRTTDEQDQQGEQRPSDEPTVPQARQQPPETLAPEIRGTDQYEDREHRAQDPIHREPELLQREALTSSNLVPEVVLREFERSGAEVGHLDQVGQEPVAVELEEGYEVEEDHEVVEHGELVEKLGPSPRGEPPDDDRCNPGQNELREGPCERLCDALPAVQHQPVGGFDEERGRPEVEREARVLDPASVVDEDERVTKLMEERQAQCESEQDE